MRWKKEEDNKEEFKPLEDDNWRNVTGAKKEEVMTKGKDERGWAPSLWNLNA